MDAVKALSNVGLDTILLIEDEGAIADTVVFALESEGFRAEWVRLGADGLARLQRPGVDLTILDVGLPDCNGFDLCKAIRRFSDLPVIFLTARGDEVDRIVGLEIGADDYVSKPFSPRELAARVKAILKRTRAPAPGTAKASIADGFVVDEPRALIHYRGQALDLTRTEYLILLTLLGQPGRVFSRAQIMDRVWQEPNRSLERAVDTHIKTLRAKLREVRPETDPVSTHRGLGYSIGGPVHGA